MSNALFSNVSSLRNRRKPHVADFNGRGCAHSLAEDGPYWAGNPWLYRRSGWSAAVNRHAFGAWWRSAALRTSV